MEPELLSFARELFRAASHYAIGVDVATGRDFDAMAAEHRRSWVRAALALRPDLGEGLSFPPGHWLHDVLPAPSSPDAHRANYAKLADVPADVLASRVVGQLILLKGNLNAYLALLEKLIRSLREEPAAAGQATTPRGEEAADA